MGILDEYLIFFSNTKAIGLSISSLISKELPKSAGKSKVHLVGKELLKAKRSLHLLNQTIYFN